MAWTKRQIINQAFDEIGIASYQFDVTTAEIENATRRLDTMIGTWEGMGIKLRYPFPYYQIDSSINSDSGIPIYATEAVYLGLAIRLASGYGKTVSPETKKSFADAFYALQNRTVGATPERKIDASSIPLGAGCKSWGSYDAFFPTPEEALETANNDELRLE